MIEQKKMPSEIPNNSVAQEEHAKDEAFTSSTDSQAAHGQSAGNKVMATHGFLKILSTIKRR